MIAVIPLPAIVISELAAMCRYTRLITIRHTHCGSPGAIIGTLKQVQHEPWCDYAEP